MILTAAAAVAGVTTLAYSPAASWISSYNHSLVVGGQAQAVSDAEPAADEQLAAAHAYNTALSSGALLQAGTSIPTGNGTSSDRSFDYGELLTAPDRTMSRIQIPSIGVDLPIYHGTSDATLRAGAGHLEGTSLPVGGAGTHSVITAHRGLANATMFTDLDQVRKGDRFVLSTFGTALTYRVTSTRVVDPDDTATLRQEAGHDLVTLITCTPLGINSHRILVTGERVLPTPAADVAAATRPAEQLAFPWWLILYGGALCLIGSYVWWARSPRRGQADRPPPPRSTRRVKGYRPS